MGVKDISICLRSLDGADNRGRTCICITNGGSFYREIFSEQHMWDCLGDLMAGIKTDRLGGEIGPENEITVFYDRAVPFFSQHYSPELLILLMLKLDGWQVRFGNVDLSSEKEQKKGMKKMNKSIFSVECPDFGCTDNFPVMVGQAERDYAHPIDAGIVKALDNPAVNAVFKSIIDLAANACWGPILASGIVVSENSYPEINKIVKECAARLNIRRPYVVISSGISGINAMTFGSDEEPYIALSTLMIRIMSPEQLRFVIGHECGHIAMGHVVYHSVASMAGELSQNLPVVGPLIYSTASLPLNAWSRRSEITADRAGLLCCGDIDVAKKTLLQLESAFLNANEVDVDEYVENSQRFLSDNGLRKIREYLDSHPIIPKRIHALNEFTGSQKYAQLTGKVASTTATDDKTLEQRVEKIVKVM